MSIAARLPDTGIESRTREIRERVSRAHIPVLDGVRGVAVLLVMTLHFTIMVPMTWGERAFFNVTNTGWAGVDLFFVLSGFLITGILYDARGSDGYFRNFYARRSLRIFPLYYAYLTLLFVIMPMVHPVSVTADGVSKQIWLWTYLGNILFARVDWAGMPGYTTHLWSLAIEEQFYLMWPLCVYLLSRSRLIQLCIALIVGAATLRIGFAIADAAPVVSYAFTFARVDTLATGGLIAVLARGDVGRAWLSRYAGRILAASVIAIALVTISVGVRSGGSYTLPALDPIVQLVGYTAIALGFGAALTLVIASPATSFAHRVLTTKAMISLGKYSYALYLIHVPLRSILAHEVTHRGGVLPRIAGSQLPAQILLILGGIAASYGLALVSWHLFEKHFLALKRFFPTTAVRRPVPAPAVVAPDVIAMDPMAGRASVKLSMTSDNLRS